VTHAATVPVGGGGESGAGFGILAVDDTLSPPGNRLVDGLRFVQGNDDGYTVLAEDEGEEPAFIICVKAEELNAGAWYIKSTMDNSAHSKLMATIALGKAKHRPATDDDLSTVQTPVT